MAYQSLYRRYRSRRFSEIKGQDHVVLALRNAVVNDQVGHAYLFSGPRGTGKTSTARILAKVLNCERPVDGEPCGECDSCLSVDAGTSYDVHELDAASNNGVDAMRDLIDKASLGTPGRSKVYILDEVHMLSKAAEAALLKTLEEPPPHVVFVLATTDPQKISPTIKSRTQHLDFRLLPADLLAEHVRYVIADAQLDVPDEAVDTVVRQGAGSARDTLSALDRVVASGGVVEADEPLDEIVEALADRDTGRALAALAVASASGRDARTLADRLVAQLRDGFLSLMAPRLVTLPDAAAARVAAQAQRLGPAALVRAMEVIGTTLAEFRHAPDPRVLLDVALVKLTCADADTSPAALLDRIERLEKSASDAPAAAATAAAPARAVLGGAKARAAEAPSPPPTAASTPADSKPPEPAPASGGLDDLERIWTDELLPKLKPLARATFSAARVVAGDGDQATFALPNASHRDRCESYRADVEAALEARFGRPVALQLIVDGGRASAARQPDSQPVPAAPPDEHVDLDELVDAEPGHAADPVARLTAAFPGAELLDETEGGPNRESNR